MCVFVCLCVYGTELISERSDYSKPKYSAIRLSIWRSASIECMEPYYLRLICSLFCHLRLTCAEIKMKFFFILHIFNLFFFLLLTLIQSASRLPSFFIFTHLLFCCFILMQNTMFFSISSFETNSFPLIGIHHSVGRVLWVNA